MLPQRSFEDYKVVACLFAILFIGVADSQILSPLLHVIQSEIGKTSSEMGLLFTGYAVCAGLSVLFWGPLSDIFGRRKGLLYGLFLFAAGSVISFLAIGFSSLLWGRIVTGMGASMMSLNTISYAADYFPYRKRGWAMGRIFSSYFAALIFGVPLGAWIGGTLGWNAVFGVVGGLAAVVFLCTWHILPEKAHNKDSGAGTAILSFIYRYGGFLKERSSLGGLLCSFFASAGIMGFISFLGKWLSDAFSVSTGKAGLVFLVFGTAAVLTSPIAGNIADRIGKRLQFIISSVMLAGALFLLPVQNWGAALFALFFCISVFSAFRQGPLEAVLTEIVPQAFRGMFIALKNSFSQLGIGLATLLSGFLFEREGYWAVCFLSAVSHLLAASFMFLTMKKRNL